MKNYTQVYVKNDAETAYAHCELSVNGEGF